MPSKAGSLMLGALVALAAIGCGSSEDPDPGVDPSDDAGALELRPIMFTPDEQPTAFLVDGGPIELVNAPQGGHVLMVGARIAHLESDVVEMTARVRDGASGELIEEAERTVLMAPVPEEPGVLENDRRSISQMVHVALCPSSPAATFAGRELIIEIEATELYADFTSGSASVRVVATCMATAPSLKALCECECSASYEPGTCGGELG
jgi:hypothetical protein